MGTSPGLLAGTRELVDLGGAGHGAVRGEGEGEEAGTSPGLLAGARELVDLGGSGHGAVRGEG